jgi:UDPglucose--hexose-1-phosphate uridylyltransferase
MEGVGSHDVIVETPRHNLATMLGDLDHVERVVEAQHRRFVELQGQETHEQVILFKNHGPDAGTSLVHPHSQIVALPMVPASSVHRMRTAMDYHNDSGRCVYCDLLAEELESGDRVVTANHHFVALVPYAAFSPFHTWVLPRRHAASFADITPEERRGLAGILKDALSRVYHGLGDPDFNLVFKTAPRSACGVGYYHWYVSIVLRLTKTAGFEMGSGMFINVSLPESDAEFLRKVKVPS